MTNPCNLVEYDGIEESVALGYLCSKDGQPCEFETRYEKYGEDADGNRGTWVEYTCCIKCGEGS